MSPPSTSPHAPFSGNALLPGESPIRVVTLAASRTRDAVFCGDPYGGIDQSEPHNG